MLQATDYLFYIMSSITILCALGVVLFSNPIYSAISLAGTMIGVATLFVNLDAWFVAGVLLIVYAGAVLVLFVMVVMLFDLHRESDAFSRGIFSGGLKLIASGMLLGILVGAVYMSAGFFREKPRLDPQIDATKALAIRLFSDYIFSFDFIGALLFIIAIGAVTLSRIHGGTHADN